MKKYIHRFDKWSEFMDNAINGNPNIMLQPAELESRKDEWGNSKPWSGAHSFDEALEFLRKGWDSGIQRLKEFQKGIPSDLFDGIMPVREYKPEMRHLIAGGGLDVAAHLSGATPETFIGEVTPHEEGSQTQQGRKLQTIYMNASNSSIMQEAAFFYRGAYTFTMIEHMENCGYSVELWCCELVQSFDGGSVKQQIYVKVKEFGEMFDSNKLAIALCSAFFIRRFTMAIQEQGCDEEIYKIQRASYGQPYRAKIGDVALPEDMDGGSNPLFIDTFNVSDPEVMLEKFKTILNNHINKTTID